MRIAQRLICLLAAVTAITVAQSSAGNETFAALEVESLELAGLTTDAATISVQLAATATRSATVSGLAFDDVAINGVPVHVPPLSSTLTLRAGERIEGLPLLHFRMAFRDLESLQPIRDIVAEERAHLRMTVRTEMQLSLFQRLMIMAPGLWVVAPVDQDIPVSIAGGPLGRAAATAALFAAEPVWILSREAIEYRKRSSEFARTAREQVEKALVRLITTYELVSRTGERAAVEHRSLGFLAASGEVFTTAEALEPWTFDAGLSEALHTGQLRLDRQTVEIIATLVSPREGHPRTYSLRDNGLKIRRLLSGAEKAVSVKTQVRYNLRVRSRDANAALLLIPALAKDTDGLKPATAAGEILPLAAIFLLPLAGPPRIVVTDARKEGERLVLGDPVDALAFGSPVWIDGGFAGLMQDARSAVPVDRLLKEFR